MTGPGRTWSVLPEDDERYRPLYARMLGLQSINPGGVLCFVYFEGVVALGALLALAELVSWWAVLILPGSVAAMVKLNDLVATVVVRSAAGVPEQERERFRREVEPAVGRASVWPPRPRPGRPVADRSVADRSVASRPAADRSVTDRSAADRPATDRSVADRSVAGGEVVARNWSVPDSDQ